MTNSINFNIYKYAILSLKQAKNKGIKNIAKPLTLLSIIDCIENGNAINNMLYFDVISEAYCRLNAEMGLSVKTKVQYPFYFLQSEEFYHLMWKDKEIKTKSPSRKLLRDNVDYAYLDNALWDMLQEEDIRQQYRTLITENFLNNKDKQ